jgi:hypothetical protein
MSSVLPHIRETRRVHPANQPANAEHVQKFVGNEIGRQKAQVEEGMAAKQRYAGMLRL